MRYSNRVSLVEVELNSRDCNTLIEWYILVFGGGKTKAKTQDIRLLGKLETMRDALMVKEDNFDKLTK